MRILIVGAGGVGGFYGAYLLKAGRAVTFLVRPQRADQLKAHGLELLAPTGNLKLPAPATVLASTLNQPFDLILLSCKAYDLESAMSDFAPAVGPETMILPLLNGMAHMDILDQRFGRTHVLGGLTTVSAGRDDEGRILHLNNLDLLQFGDRDEPASQRVQRIAETLDVPGFSAPARPNILKDMWQKWIAISTAASVTCLMRATIGDIVAAGAVHLVHEVIAEAASVATSEGYPPAHDYLNVTLAKFTQPGSLFTTSMLRDIEANNPIEDFQIIGDLLAHARRRKLSTPLLEVVNANLLCYSERRRREKSKTNAKGAEGKLARDAN